MEFRLAIPTDTEEVSSLWAYCFEPKEDPFFQYYFENCYEPENTMVGIEEGQLLSTVHLRQYDLNVRGTTIPTSYMIGVATHPAARRGGIGGALLLSSLEELKQRDQGITILMPSKAAFYQQYGWELYAHQWVQTLPLDELRPMTDRSLHFGLLNSVEQWTLLAPVYDEYTTGLSGYAVRGETEWKRLLGSFFAEGVNVAVARNELGDIEAYCVYRLGAPEIMVSELVYISRRGQKSMLNYLYNHRSQGESIRWNEGLHDVGYRFHPNGKTGHTTMPYMMSRIVDVQTAVESIPVDADAAMMEITFTLAVRDELCAWNEGIYEITLGGASAALDIADVQNKDDLMRLLGVNGGTPKVKKISDSSEGTSDVYIEVGALSLLLMGAVSANELAFEEKIQGGQEWLDYLDLVYPKQNTYINEWW